MQAKQKLDQTTETLRSIVEEFKDTPSASVAERMIQAYQHDVRGVPTRSAESDFAVPESAPTEVQ
jgi:hypothetical protein